MAKTGPLTSIGAAPTETIPVTLQGSAHSA
jgi:hypothetical protein